MRSAAARRWLRVAAVAGVFVAGLVALALWTTPPSWLAGSQRFAAAALRWTRQHLLTVGGVGVVLGILKVIVPFLVRRLESQGTAAERRRVRDRQVMLARVRHRWINGVLDQTLANQTRICLGLKRRPDVIAQPTMIRLRKNQAEPLPAGTCITTMFDALGGGLLILGAPGSGKTTALLELARHLLDVAETDQTNTKPIPVVFNLSSWAARRPPLAEWLVDELASSYDVPRRIARQWVGANEVLPLLDGLDEVAAHHRTGCIEAINTFCREYGLVRFVVCSRTGDYTDLTALLHVEEALEQQPLSGQQIHDYLAAAGRGLAEVQAALEADVTLCELLSCPLVLNIAALTYRDQPAAELRTPGSPAQRLERLFTAYTERMLIHRPTGRYAPARMRRWLAWLARSMQQRGQSEFHLDRLTADWLPTKTQRWLAAVLPALVGGPAVGLLFGLLLGLFGGLGSGLTGGLGSGLMLGLASGLFIGLAGRLGGGWRSGLVLGFVSALLLGLIFGSGSRLVAGLQRGALAFGLLFGFAAGVSKTEPVEEVHWSWKGLVAGLRSGLVFGLVAGVLLGLYYGLVLGLADGLLSAVLGALIGALIFGSIGALVFGLMGGLAVGLTNERSTPNEGIHRSARHALSFGLLFGLVSGLLFGLPFGLASGLFFGLFFALFFGLGFGGLTCLRHLTLRGLLAAYGFAPLRYIHFLDEATNRLFLRRAGSGYLFVHRLLLDHLAGSGPTRLSTETDQVC